MDSSKQRRVSMKSSEQFWKRQHTDSSAMENWVLARQRVGKILSSNLYWHHLQALKLRKAAMLSEISVWIQKTLPGFLISNLVKPVIIRRFQIPKLLEMYFDKFGFTIFHFPGQQYCWSDTASCISETASTTILPNHLSSMDIISAAGVNGGSNLGGKSGGKLGIRPTSNLETASAVALGRKSYNNLRTTHYGLIDWPSPKAVLATSNGKSEFFL